MVEISSKLKYACRKCVDHNTPIYANALFAYLVGEIAKLGDIDSDGCYDKEMESFDKALSFLCNELLRLGHSKNHLFMKAIRLLNGDFTVEELKNQLLAQKENTYEIIYKFQSNQYIDSCKSEYGFVDNLDETKKKLTNQKGEIRFK